MNDDKDKSLPQAVLGKKDDTCRSGRRCLGITKEIKRCRNSKSGRFYCHKHKRQPIHFLVAAILAVSLNYIAALIPMPLKQKSLIISPSLVHLHSQDSVIHSLVEVRNPNDFSVYSVSVQLVPKGVPAESIRVEMDKGDPLLELAIDEQVKASQDTIRINGSVSGLGDVILLRIFTIPPNASKRFRVFGTQPVESSASLSIEGWQRIPEEMVSGPRGAGSRIHFNRNLTIRSIGLVVRATPNTNQISISVGNAPTVLTLGDGQRKTNITGLVFYQDREMLGIDGSVFLGSGEFISMQASEFPFSSPPFEQNRNGNALEIVDSEKRVVFQTVQKPDHLQVYGMFPVSNGIWVADVNSNRFISLTNRAELRSGLNVKRLFKYPAAKYPGRLELR